MAITMHMAGTTQPVSKIVKCKVSVATLHPWPGIMRVQLRTVGSRLESSHPRQLHWPHSVVVRVGEIRNVLDKAPLERQDHNKVVIGNNVKVGKAKIQQWIEEIRGMFRSMADGEISKSPYDTAWVARVPALDGSDADRPQFPKALQWIIDNQLADGSWGDSGYFSYHDRICNTLACIVVLQHWNTDSAAVQAGVKFIQQNLHMMETERNIHTVAGVEIVFPTLINDARKLGLDLPYDSAIIVTMTVERKKKLNKIPMEIVHKIPTTLLYSLEGLHEEVDWRKLLKLQSEDGSFHNSPSATAACLLHIRDEKALAYLNRVLDRFNNAVPHLYSVDLFERMWVVDRIQRLGVDRYFQKEIKNCLDYVYKYFTSFGIGYTRGSSVQDLDDTAMGFRLLRQHGYEVNENVFRQFRGENGEFFCYDRESNDSLTALFNFYRATQTRFAGESLLESGESFSRNFLTDKRDRKECFDKWIISKDLAGEVEYALETPWYCSLPRLETRAYLNHYGPHDIWIGKSLYRMPFVTNQIFLDLAKADFNLCQSIHQQDLQQILRWNEECEFGKLTYVRQKCHVMFFLAAIVFPDPELAPARLVFTQNCVLSTVVDDYFDVGGVLHDKYKFVAAAKEWDPSLMDDTDVEARIIFKALYNSINAMTREGISAQGRDIGLHIRNSWLRFLNSIMTDAERTASGYSPSFDEYLENALPSIAMETVLLSSLFFLGEPVSDELIHHPKRVHLMELVSRVGRLANDIQGHEREASQGKTDAVSILLRENLRWTEEDVIAKLRAMVNESMLELVREVHQPLDHIISKPLRQAHFNTARALNLIYKETDGLTSMTAMKEPMKKILSEPVF